MESPSKGRNLYPRRPKKPESDKEEVIDKETKGKVPRKVFMKLNNEKVSNSEPKNIPSKKVKSETEDNNKSKSSDRSSISQSLSKSDQNKNKSMNKNGSRYRCYSNFKMDDNDETVLKRSYRSKSCLMKNKARNVQRIKPPTKSWLQTIINYDGCDFCDCCENSGIYQPSYNQPHNNKHIIHNQNLKRRMDLSKERHLNSPTRKSHSSLRRTSTKSLCCDSKESNRCNSRSNGKKECPRNDNKKPVSLKTSSHYYLDDKYGVKKDTSYTDSDLNDNFSGLRNYLEKNKESPILKDKSRETSFSQSFADHSFCSDETGPCGQTCCFTPKNRNLNRLHKCSLNFNNIFERNNKSRRNVQNTTYNSCHSCMRHKYDFLNNTHKHQSPTDYDYHTNSIKSFNDSGHNDYQSRNGGNFNFMGAGIGQRPDHQSMQRVKPDTGFHDIASVAVTFVSAVCFAGALTVYGAIMFSEEEIHMEKPEIKPPVISKPPEVILPPALEEIIQKNKEVERKESNAHAVEGQATITKNPQFVEDLVEEIESSSSYNPLRFLSSPRSPIHVDTTSQTNTEGLVAKSKMPWRFQNYASAGCPKQTLQLCTSEDDDKPSYFIRLFGTPKAKKRKCKCKYGDQCFNMDVYVAAQWPAHLKNKMVIRDSNAPFTSWLQENPHVESSKCRKHVPNILDTIPSEVTSDTECKKGFRDALVSALQGALGG